MFTLIVLSLEVGDTCLELNPCPAKILCKDKCDYPFYECVYCDESHYGLLCDKLKGMFYLSYWYILIAVSGRNENLEKSVFV